MATAPSSVMKRGVVQKKIPIQVTGREKTHISKEYPAPLQQPVHAAPTKVRIITEHRMLTATTANQTCSLATSQTTDIMTIQVLPETLPVCCQSWDLPEI